MFMAKRKTTADDVRRVAIAALTAALDDRKDEARSKPGLTGVRAVATGAVLYTAGRAAFSSRRFLRERFGSDEDQYENGDGPEAEADDEYEEPEAEAEEDEEYEEPEAEAEEDEEDEEYEEPEAEEDEDDEDEEYEEPEAEGEEDDDEDEYEEPEAEEDEDDGDAASRRPPVHAEDDSDDELDPDLPDRPSRSRAPVGRR